MNRAKWMFSTLAIMIIALFVTLTSCQNPGNNPIGASTSGEDIYNSPEMLVAGIISTPAVTDATLESDMQIQMGVINCPPPPRDSGRLGQDSGRVRPPMPIGRLLWTLKLSKGQADTLRTFLGDYRKCIQSVMALTETQRRAIIDSANVQRRAIMEAVKAGTITRTEARAQLTALNTATRAALAGLIDQAALCNCLTTYYASIRAILTADQQVQWDAWVATLKGPCFS